MTDFEDNRKAGKAIAEESPEAVGLLVAILEKNADDQWKLEQSIYKSMEKDRDDWKARCLSAEKELIHIQNRVCLLVGVDLRGFDGA